MAMQILLRRQSGSIPDTGWQELLTLEAHIQGLKNETIYAINKIKWQDIELMSQAVAAFSGVSESPDVVQALVARVRFTPFLPPLFQDTHLLTELMFDT